MPVECVYSQAGNVTGKTTVMMGVMRLSAGKLCALLERSSVMGEGVSRTVMFVMEMQVQIWLISTFLSLKRQISIQIVLMVWMNWTALRHCYLT